MPENSRNDTDDTNATFAGNAWVAVTLLTARRFPRVVRKTAVLKAVNL